MADVMGHPQGPHPQHQSFADQDFDESDMGPPSFGPITPGPNGARRAPRKSTLTQQQKNHKRQRATTDQLMTLEVEFNKNPTPTALVRERIADEINMTERSVQIWFQNRRAKIKNIAKRSIENGEDCDNIPDSMRQYLAMQQYGPNKALGGSMLGRPGSAYMPYGSGMLMNGDSAAGKVVIQHFACRSLSVGTWRRVGQSTMDLVIFYSPDKACVTYYIHNENAGYKIEYPFAWIKNITLEQGDALSAAEGASQRAGGLIIELTRPPRFYMDSSGQGGFYECGDFTEDQQATQILVHHLGGPSKVLSGQLAKLISLEAYQTRHNVFDPNSFAVSAPVSPVGIPRPASQPNHPVHPHNPRPAMHLHPQEHAPGMMGPPGPRGHKRQRSRSVPVAVDFSMLRHPMPSFLIQHEGQSAQQAIQHDPNIWAPVPQHHASNPGGNGFQPGPIGPNLSIDTSAGYHNFNFGGPLSATTANSPSEFGTPAFFTSAPPSDSTHPTQFGTPFNNGFLAVDSAAMIGTSNTPLSIASSQHDPVIADHSPPLNGLGRSQSADIFGTPGDSSQFGDEGIYLSETFNKQLSLPFRSPFAEDSFHSPLPESTFSFDPAETSTFKTQTPRDASAGAGAPPASSSSLPFHSPASSSHPNAQVHQDSGVAFSTPTPHHHLSPDQHPNAIYAHSSSSASPPNHKDPNMALYGKGGEMFSSPAQMAVLPRQQQQQQFHQQQQQQHDGSSGVWSHHASPMGSAAGYGSTAGDGLSTPGAGTANDGSELVDFGEEFGLFGGTVDPNQLGSGA